MRRVSYFMAGTVAGLLLMVFFFVAWRWASGSATDQAWKEFEETDRAASAQLRTGEVPNSTVLERNQSAFQVLRERGEILPLALNAYEPINSRIILENDIQLYLPMSMKMGGQRSENLFFVRPCDEGVVEERLKGVRRPL